MIDDTKHTTGRGLCFSSMCGREMNDRNAYVLNTQLMNSQVQHMYIGQSCFHCLESARRTVQAHACCIPIYKILNQ